ncbi:beta-propeller fold lactonase family protein [Sinomonas sp. JGH33]|uniref:Beta-propeller fold lactonase family protein n=1 Tax=Sinomonas terricola TaxID=3110330 RepID=A0ABU5TBL5_9MICC|nr:beta-propeller fold lactonase family protein [Sinomonas sp. JGH33]MEA5456905.1 beta-propeller fold lactonase family protein [Sinomonas sp. JGH33]
MTAPVEARELLLVASGTAHAGDAGRPMDGSLAVCQFAPHSGLSVEARLPGPSRPLYAAAHPTTGVAYVASLDGGGSIHAVDLRSGRTAATRSGGEAPCHIAISPDGSLLFCANYSGGSVSAHRLREGGELGRMTAFVDLSSGVLSGRGSQVSKPHHIEVCSDSPGELLVADLGRSDIRRFAYRKNGSLAGLAGGLEAGAPNAALGTRSLARDASGHLWCSEEHSSTVSRMAVHGDGRIRRTHTWPATSRTGSRRNYPGQIVASADRRSVYAANRGRDTITVCSARKEGLGPIQEVGCGGRWPSALAVLGQFLLVANRDSDNISALLIDPDDGTLGPARQVLSVPRPAALALVSAPRNRESA